MIKKTTKKSRGKGLGKKQPLKEGKSKKGIRNAKDGMRKMEKGERKSAKRNVGRIPVPVRVVKSAVSNKAKSAPSSSFFPYGIVKHDDLKWHKQRFQKLVKKVPESERAGIEKAYTFSEERHAKLKRYDGTLYIIHPIRMANIIIDEWNMTDPTLITAALLHDVVEDTQTTIKEVKDAFGADVGKLVDGITMWKGSETPEVYLKRVTRGPELLRVIKCADTLDNLRSWHECADDIADKFPRWWRQAKDYIIPMAHKTLKKAEHQINDIVEDDWYLKRANMV